jgi:type VI secretion system secreted protein VgrG
MHFPLAPGTEVLVGFVDGDPDRPIIVGAAPTPEAPSPVDQKNAGHFRVETTTGVMVHFGDAY